LPSTSYIAASSLFRVGSNNLFYSSIVVSLFG
jgi:hypothetical protein